MWKINLTEEKGGSKGTGRLLKDIETEGGEVDRGGSGGKDAKGGVLR